MSDDDTKDDNTSGRPSETKVGYGRPPLEHRFKKGRSGNPRGRPKGSQDKRSIAQKVLLEEHEVTENGQRVRCTTLQLVLLALRNKAAEGNAPAFKVFEKLDAEFDPPAPIRMGGALVVPGRLTKEAWVELFGAKVDATQKE